MKPYKTQPIASSEITPRELFYARRKFMQLAGSVSLTALLPRSVWAGDKLAEVKKSLYTVQEELTPYKDVTQYNNFYEFGTSKEDPANNAGSLKTRPWTVTIEGEVKKPRVFDIEELLKMAPLEERVYRLRCVEAWSMVVPWIGFSLAELIKKVEPTGNAKFVEFISLHDPEQMPGQKSPVLEWPYREGLRMDEAMHPLTLLTFGLYGEVLPNQNGAPVRVVVPWKYGFKSAKSIVSIRLTEKQPVTSWMQAGGLTITAFIPTSTPMPITRAGVRPKNDASVNSSDSRRCCLTVTRMRSGNCMRAWTSTNIFDFMSIKNLDNKTLARIKTVVFLLALIPLAKLGFGAYLDTLGANPIEKITRITGYWTLTFLLISLTLTPLRRMLSWLWLIRLRRMLSLFAFFYACLHFLTYLVLDQFFDWESIIKDIIKRPYITVGFPAFLLMIPMAVTSTDAMIRRLGGKHWRLLHRLVYLCAVGGVVHYWWLVKKDLTNPFTFAVWLGLLLGIRLLYWLGSLRKQRLSAHTAISP